MLKRNIHYLLLLAHKLLAFFESVRLALDVNDDTMMQDTIDKREIQEIWNNSQAAIKPVDINGALVCKDAYGDRCITVFVRRGKEAIIKSLLQRDVSRRDTVKRLMSLDSEQFFDWTVFNNGTLKHAVQQILQIVAVFLVLIYNMLYRVFQPIQPSSLCNGRRVRHGPLTQAWYRYCGN